MGRGTVISPSDPTTLTVMESVSITPPSTTDPTRRSASTGNEAAVRLRVKAYQPILIVGSHGNTVASSCVDDPAEARAIWCVRRGRVRSLSGPMLRGLMTAGPDAIRSLAPKQIYALEWRITLDGFFQAPGSTGSPSRHHRPHSPISCGNR